MHTESLPTDARTSAILNYFFIGIGPHRQARWRGFPPVPLADEHVEAQVERQQRVARPGRVDTGYYLAAVLAAP